MTKLYPKLTGLAIGIQMFFVYNKQALERWPSGLRRTPGTRVGAQASRRFESCSLRQKKNFTLQAWSFLYMFLFRYYSLLIFPNIST